MANIPYIEVLHEAPELQTIADLVSTDGGNTLFQLYADNGETELLDYNGGTQYTNRDRVKRLYSKEELDENQSTSDDQLPLKVGTVLLLPKNKLNTNTDSLLLTQSFQPNDGTKFNVFVSDTLRELLANNNYKPIDLGSGGKVIESYPKITVWIWSRTLNELINVSPFVYSCSTNSGDDGTGFSLSLAPIIAKYSDGWKIDRRSVTDFTSKEFIAQSNLFKSTNPNSFKESDFYFTRVLSPNDLIFIQYEALELEKNERAKDSSKFSVDYGEIPGRIYDLIGFVDTVSMVSNPQSAEIGIQVQGRDLSKALLDTGSYFHIEEYLGTLFPNNDQSEKLRSAIYGKIENFSTMGYRSITEHINIILNLLAPTGYVPNEIFEAYGENKNQSLNRNIDKVKEFETVNESQKQATIISIEQSRAAYGLTLPDSKLEKAAVTQAYSTLSSLGKSKTLVDSISSTLTQQALSSLNGSLFDRSQLLSEDLSGLGVAGAAINASIREVSYSNQEPQSEVEQVDKDGIWQIFDVEVDPSISNIRIADSSISEANGSLLSTIQAVAEEPFMEVFMDTYKDRFKLIARRQPFNEQYYNELVDETVIDIEPEQVLGYNLQFNDNEAYSWYMLTPANVFYGEVQALKGFIPPVVLKEYVDIWGSKPYEKITSYKPFKSETDSDSIVDIDIRQAIRDLKYMIEINAPLPFTRYGSITINGNRAIKKKTAIRLKQTGEIFHVDNLVNDYKKGESIDRTTTLNVSHGMIEKFMKGNSIQGINEPVSYFNIVRTDFDEKSLNEDSEPTDVIKDWGVNTDVFNFFLQKRQFQ